MTSEPHVRLEELDGLVDAVLAPVHPGNPFEETVERLLRLIKLGVATPGDRLPPERELSARMGVSRETLREAIGSLREAGYLASRRGRAGGTFVVARDGGQPVGLPAGEAFPVGATVQDVLAVRFALETGAAELAARRTLPAEDRGMLMKLDDEVCAAAPDDYRPADSRLHLAIAEATGAPWLAALVADARSRTNDLLDRIPLLPRNIDHSNRQHRRIVAAIVTDDTATARAAMAEHLDGTAALLRAFLS